LPRLIAGLQLLQPYTGGLVMRIDSQHALQAHPPFGIGFDHRAHPQPALFAARVGL
jgi:hypothetical protein